MFSIGDIVQLKVKCLGNNPGVRGIVYEQYTIRNYTHRVQHSGVSVIFPNGKYDEFSQQEQKDFLTKKGCIRTFNYHFSNVVQLQRDINSGYFKRYFNQLQSLQKFESTEDQFTKELDLLLRQKGIKRPEK